MLPPTPIASKRRSRGPALAALAELRDERAVPRSSLFKTSKAPRGAKGACHARILALLFCSSVIKTGVLRSRAASLIAAPAHPAAGRPQVRQSPQARALGGPWRGRRRESAAAQSEFPFTPHRRSSGVAGEQKNGHTDHTRFFLFYTGAARAVAGCWCGTRPVSSTTRRERRPAWPDSRRGRLAGSHATVRPTENPMRKSLKESLIIIAPFHLETRVCDTREYSHSHAEPQSHSIGSS